MSDHEIVSAWIEENRVPLRQWTNEAVRIFSEDASVRLPRTESERRNGMEEWLEQRRIKLAAALHEEFPRYFPSQVPHLLPSFVTSVFDELVWPQVKPEVQRYAIFGFAAAWVGRYMGDATTIGTPRRDGQQWCVPIGVKGYGDDLGQVMLNLDGEIIPEVTTTHGDLLEAIREPSIQTLTAATR